MTTPNPTESETAAVLRAAYLEIRRLRSRVGELEQAAREPVAVVGIGCRFPGGVDSPDAYWELLRTGTDAVSDCPADRWNVDSLYDPRPHIPGKMYVRRGGFLRDVDRFDAAFFGIAPREAAGMDPQQRFLLETAWEALEHSGIAPAGLVGSRTGVFVGIATNDYSARQLRAGGGLDAHHATGTSFAVAAGRLSYVLGLQGPALAIDTACSSSLVSIHLAVQSLRRRECDLALAGGVSLMLSPDLGIIFCQAGMLSPDGRCKTFDASADGYGRGEGCGIVVLKRLSDATRDGDRILAVVRGSAVNQDGRSAGLTAPNGPAQERLIRDALADAGVDSASIGYVEAHGTGTPLGDPIELRAIAAVLSGPDRAAHPLLIGSAKTNFGHLEAAAGVAGFIKAVLAVRAGVLPPHLHLRTPNPRFDWADSGLRVVDHETPWTAPQGVKRRAGVSSFGFSGTNAHMIVEEAETLPVAETKSNPFHLLLLSARCDAALRELASRYAVFLAGVNDSEATTVCHAAWAGRSHFGHRLAVVGGNVGELQSGLAAFSAGRVLPSGVHHGVHAEGGLSPELALPEGDVQGRPLLEAIAKLYVRGMSLDPTRVFGVGQFRRVTLPTYPFQRARYWTDESPRRAAWEGRVVRSPRIPGAAYEVELDTERIPDLLATNGLVHVGFLLEILTRVAESVAGWEHWSLTDVAFTRPTVVPERRSLTVQVLWPTTDRDDAFELFCRTDGDWTNHARGNVGRAGSPSVVEACEVVRERCSEYWSSDEFYRNLAARGFSPGPAAKWVAEVWRHDGETIARIRTAEPGEAGGYKLGTHPGVLEACVQLFHACLPGGAADRTLFMLAAVDKVTFHGKGGGELWCHTRMRSYDSVGGVGGDFVLFDGLGRVIAEARGAFLRPTDPVQWKNDTADLYAITWRPRPLTPTAGTSPGRWLVLGSDDVLRAKLAELLSAAAGVSDTIRGVLFLGTETAREFPREITTGLTAAVEALRCAVEQNLPEVVFVTRGARATGNEGVPTSVGGAPSWGLAHVAAMEFPDTRIRCIDLDPVSDPHHDTAQLTAELATFDGENEVTYRDGMRLVSRLTPLSPDVVKLPDTYRIEVDLNGSGVSIHPLKLRAPGPGEVEVRVSAAAINFRDVLAAGGLIAADFAPGADCAGVVVSLGIGVTGLTVGQRVLVRGDGCLATHMIADARQIVPLPDRLTNQEAATLPIPYLTARYALHDLADIGPGDTVLIHAAGGGVGLAAVRVAVRSGAKVFATASPGKWERLRSEGVEGVFHSRRSGFGESVRTATGGGVAVVLNSLGSEFTEESLSALSSGGRFIELGKRGDWNAERVAAVRPDVRYHRIDLDDVTAREPERLSAMLADVAQNAEPLPTRAFPVLQAATAFRVMSRGRHIGRVILTLNDPTPEILRPDGLYLITGGLGALGLLVAERLAERGAGCVVLVDRRLPDSAAEAVMDRIRARGTTALIIEADITDRDEVRRVVRYIANSHSPPRGIVHTAAVMDTTSLRELTADRIAAVLAPKVMAASYLDEETRRLPLDFFVLFSSVAAHLPAGRQGAYAAANAALDAIAEQRRALGFPATSIAWGPWDAGIGATLAASSGQAWDAWGVRAFSPQQGLALFDVILHRNTPSVVVAVRADWSAYSRQFVPGRLSPLTTELFPRVANQSLAVVSSDDPTQELKRLPPDLLRHRLREEVRVAAARVIGAEPGELDEQSTFRDLGLDSIMGVELMNSLGRRLGQRLPATLPFNYPTVGAVAEHLALLIAVPSTSTGEAGSTDDAESRLAAIEAFLRDGTGA
jgi:acyl transferase domain-containing protein/acyl carrier protein